MSRSSELLATLKVARTESETLHEARVPTVGIFYVTDGHLISLDAPVPLNKVNTLDLQDSTAIQVMDRVVGDSFFICW